MLNKNMFLKLFSMFSVVRGYNIVIIILAQYLASIFILGHNLGVKEVVFDLYLLLIVLASSATIAGGYIINNFYDSEKDLINRPQKTKIDTFVSQNTKLSLYFVLNFIAVIMASYVSFRAVVFFSTYIFGIWIYSHKLKKVTLVGNIVSALLSVAPFFAIFLYYKNFETVVFVHASFLFLIILIRDCVKDLENLKGDLAQDYKTVPIVFGVKASKQLITLLVLLCAIPIYYLTLNFNIGRMAFYFYITILMLLLFLLFLWRSKTKLHFMILHNILKIIIVLGVFSIVLIDMNVILRHI